MTYLHDFDQNGVIYYIGTCGKTVPFRNPAEEEGEWGVHCFRGTLQFMDQRKSSDALGSAADMCSRANVDTMSGDHKDAWWLLDLGPGRTVTPQMYTIRHGHFTPLNSLRNWRLESSLSGKPSTWHELHSHLNDESLDDGYATATWAVKTINTAHMQPCRFLRIVQTAANSSDNNMVSDPQVQQACHVHAAPDLSAALSCLVLYLYAPADQTPALDWRN